MDDVFADTSYGRVALKRFKAVSPNFRIYYCGFVDDDTQTGLMFVTGAEFRAATRGPRKGKLCIMVSGTKRTTYVTQAEMRRIQKQDMKRAPG